MTETTTFEFTPPELVTSLRPKSEGIRILAPTGEIGFIPEEQLPGAIEAGAVELTPEKMRELRQAIFMQHGVFTEKNTPPAYSPRKQKHRLFKSRRQR